MLEKFCTKVQGGVGGGEHHHKRLKPNREKRQKLELDPGVMWSMRTGDRLGRETSSTGQALNLQQVMNVFPPQKCQKHLL